MGSGKGILLPNLEKGKVVKKSYDVTNYNPGHKILELCNVLVQGWYVTNKTKLHIWHNKLGDVSNGLSHESSEEIYNP